MRHLDTAIDLAQTSNARQRHGAVLVRKGRVVGVGVNVVRPVVAGRSGYRFPSRHAEQEAISMAGGRAKGATLYIARVNKRGEPVMSAPCPRCLSAIKRSGIVEVHFTA